MKLSHIVLAVILILLTGCASHLKDIKNPELPLVRKHYSVRVPQAGKWKIIDEQNPYNVYIGSRQGDTHTFIAYAIATENVPQFASPEEFFIYFKTQLSFNEMPDRQKQLKADSSKDNRFGEYSMKYNVFYEDINAPNAPRGTSLLVKFQGYVILLPKKTALIMIYFSERGLKEEMVQDFDVRAEEFIQSLMLNAPPD